MAKENIPTPSSSLIYFIIITFIYIFFTIFSITSSNSTKDIESNSSNKMFNMIYITLLIIGSYFINVNISKAICDSNSIQWNQIFMITILPWVIIFSMIYFLLELFPGWVTPFSNTFGYLVVNLLGVETVLKDVLSDGSKNGDAGQLTQAINNIKKNMSKFINEIDLANGDYESFVKQLKTEGLLKQELSNKENYMNDENKKELFKLVNIKHVIGKSIWYILCGILIASITYNFIINITCNKTLAETQREYNKIIEEQNTEDPN